MNENNLTSEQAIAILINCLADFDAGRMDPEKAFAGQEFGFSQRHKDRAKQVLAHLLTKLPL